MHGGAFRAVEVFLLLLEICKPANVLVSALLNGAVCRDAPEKSNPESQRI